MGERPNGGLVCLSLDNVKSISEESKNETSGSCGKPIILDLYSKPTKYVRCGYFHDKSIFFFYKCPY